MKHISYILFFIVTLWGCTDNRSKNDGDGGYSDGTYCANVTYYNSNTGTEHTYRLNVDVENNELIRIHWNNGGWLDESHFTPQELDNSGYCSFTSDKGYAYKVAIMGSACSDTDERKLKSDKEASSCPKCGEDKEEYDTYCYHCKRKIEDEEEEKKDKKDKEEHTCPKCGNYDSFMFSTDDECSDCKRKREREEEEEEEKRKRNDEE